MAEAIFKGAPVIIKGLQKEEYTHFNGQKGVVTDGPSETGRYEVRLQGAGYKEDKVLALKPSNFQLDLDALQEYVLKKRVEKAQRDPPLEDLSVLWTKGKGLSAKSLTWKRQKERLRVLMLYHLCALLLLCLERVVGFVKGCQELEMEKKLTNREEILKMDCNTYQARLCLKFVLDAGLMSYFAFIIWSLIVRIEAGELGEPSLLREQELADRALGDPWLFVQTPGESATFLRREPRGHAPTPFSGVPRNLEDQEAQASLQEEGQAHDRQGRGSVEAFQGTPYRLE